VNNIAPDNRAIDSLLDRTFGKAQQSVEIIDNQKPSTDDFARSLLAYLVEKLDIKQEEAIDSVLVEFPEADKIKLLGDGK
jgi:hypothetical protein